MVHRPRRTQNRRPRGHPSGDEAVRPDRHTMGCSGPRGPGGGTGPGSSTFSRPTVVHHRRDHVRLSGGHPQTTNDRHGRGMGFPESECPAGGVAFPGRPVEDWAPHQLSKGCHAWRARGSDGRWLDGCTVGVHKQFRDLEQCDRCWPDGCSRGDVCPPLEGCCACCARGSSGRRLGWSAHGGLQRDRSIVGGKARL